MNIQITNQKLYDSLNLIDVEIDVETELSHFPHDPYGFKGVVSIVSDERAINIFGEHGFNDYQSEYGFVIKP